MKIPIPPLRIPIRSIFTLLLVFAGLTKVSAEGPGVHGRVFEVKEGGAIVGVVSGAKIEFIGGPSATTDGTGYYKANIPPGSYVYKVSAPGFKDEDSGRGMQLQLPEGFAVYNFALEKGENDPDRAPPPRPEIQTGRLKGKVFEKDMGNPGNGGAVITFRQGDHRDLSRVISAEGGTGNSATGNYEISLPVGIWKASVLAQGFERFVDPDPIVIRAGTDSDRDFGLSRPGIKPDADQGIRGVVRVIPGNRKPVSLREVSLRVIPQDSGGEQTGQLGSNGDFTFPLVPGSYRVEASATGYETAQSGPVYVFPDRFSNVKLALRGDLGLKVEFFVYDGGTKRPLPGAVVQLLGKDGKTAGGEGRTDQSGMLTLRLADAGTWTTKASLEGYKPWSQSGRLPTDPESRVKIALEPGAGPVPPELTKAAQLRVTVLDARKKRPVAGASVTLRKGSQRLADSTRGSTGSEGQVQLKLPDKGSYTALVQAEGYKAGGERVEIGAGESKSIQVVLEPVEMSGPPAPLPNPPAGKEQTLSVQVVGRGGAPVPGAAVSIMDRDRIIGIGQADAKGSYGLKVPAGSYTLRAEAQGYDAGGAEITMSAGNSAKVKIALSPMGAPTTPAPQMSALGVQVVRPDGRAIPGAAIRVIQGNQIAGSGGTDGQGVFQAILPPGVYALQAEARGYNTGSAVARLEARGGSVRIILTPTTSMIPPVTQIPPEISQPQKLILRILVLQRGGGPIPGAVVSVAQDRQVIGRGVTDNSGAWSTVAGPGIYSLMAEARGYMQGGTVATVNKQSVEARIQLTPAGNTGPSTTLNPPTQTPTIPGFNPNRIPQVTIPGKTFPGFKPGTNSQENPSPQSMPSAPIYVVEGLQPGSSQWQPLARFNNPQQAQAALATYQVTYGARKWQLRISTQQGR